MTAPRRDDANAGPDAPPHVHISCGTDVDELTSACDRLTRARAVTLTVDPDAADRLGWSLQRLPRLRELRLLRTALSGGLRALGSGLLQLRVLWVVGCQLATLDGISALPQLTELYVARNQLQDVSACSCLDQLQVLDVEDNQLAETTSLMFLRVCSELRKLELRGNPVCADAAQLRELEHWLPQLHSLNGCATAAGERALRRLQRPLSEQLPPVEPRTAELRRPPPQTPPSPVKSALYRAVTPPSPGRPTLPPAGKPQSPAKQALPSTVKPLPTGDMRHSPVQKPPSPAKTLPPADPRQSPDKKPPSPAKAPPTSDMQHSPAKKPPSPAKTPLSPMKPARPPQRARPAWPVSRATPSPEVATKSLAATAPQLPGGSRVRPGSRRSERGQPGSDPEMTRPASRQSVSSEDSVASLPAIVPATTQRRPTRGVDPGASGESRPPAAHHSGRVKVNSWMNTKTADVRRTGAYK